MYNYNHRFINIIIANITCIAEYLVTTVCNMDGILLRGHGYLSNTNVSSSATCSFKLGIYSSSIITLNILSSHGAIVYDCGENILIGLRGNGCQKISNTTIEKHGGTILTLQHYTNGLYLLIEYNGKFKNPYVYYSIIMKYN